LPPDHFQQSTDVGRAELFVVTISGDAALPTTGAISRIVNLSDEVGRDAGVA